MGLLIFTCKINYSHLSISISDFSIYPGLEYKIILSKCHRSKLFLYSDHLECPTLSKICNCWMFCNLYKIYWQKYVCDGDDITVLVMTVCCGDDKSLIVTYCNLRA